jgi:hypothetical protein
MEEVNCTQTDNYNEFYHHGIKGQKWGVRRYQKKDGSLTSAGKKRYSGDPKDRANKVTRYDKLYAKYKDLGYDDEKARQSTKGQVATEKALLIVGGMAVAAAAGYAVYRYRDITKDRVISPKQVMQTVHQGDVSDRIQPGNPFFASYTKRDNTIYASKVFSHFTDKSNVTRFYTEDGIKAASEKTGRKIFDDLVKTNPEVAEYSKRIGKFGQGRKAYEKFNYSLVLRNDSPTAKKMGLDDLDHDKIHNIFYDELKKRGYGAVIDVNDSRREGFTFNPVIVFDNQIKHVVGTTKATDSQLHGEQALKGIKYAMQRKTMLNPLKNPAVAATGYGYLYAVGIAANKNTDLDLKAQFVNQYLKDHPNTRKSRVQIAEMYG